MADESPEAMQTETVAAAPYHAAKKDHFLAAVRKFMEMETLTPPLLRELIDHIDVYETQGTGKHRTQRITIFYRFVGYIDIPESPEDEPYTADTRQGVAVKYIPKLA